MDPINSLSNRIRLGEDSALELKRVVVAGKRIVDPARDAIADRLAALANARGGSIVFGVDDKTREVIGISLSDLDVVERWLTEICSDKIKPPLNVHVRRLELPDTSGVFKAVLVADIERSLYVHQSPGGWYRRVGSQTLPIPYEAVVRLIQERSQTRVIRFDESPVPGTSPAELEPGLMERFFPGTPNFAEISLDKLRLITRDPEGSYRMTVAGALLCTARPQSWLPQAEIAAVSYAGERTDVNYQNDARDIAGPIDEQVVEALHFVRRNMRVHAEKRTGRIDIPQFSDRAVFEALVNAVAHRDYSMSGARIRLHLFADRLELYVPGALSNTLTPDSMALRQYSRNELIVSLLARCPVDPETGVGRARMMDRRGDGVPIILKESEELSGRSPEYSVIDDAEVRLIIWAATSVSGSTNRE